MQYTDIVSKLMCKDQYKAVCISTFRTLAYHSNHSDSNSVNCASKKMIILYIYTLCSDKVTNLNENKRK